MLTTYGAILIKENWLDGEVLQFEEGIDPDGRSIATKVYSRDGLRVIAENLSLDGAGILPFCVKQP